ncbi:hypothetical protein RchiOBHm_Chr6g0295221 [Rosa chinensis]|uniref:Uncharacterized protein n=1 Tax=Rosa chinensis TaxID=74649 RepID=A0A2P6PX28_ROSCH|nr:hypothetical protein RchiOBHm_Chr6g0295221 [Rosa chinensis]
MILIPYGITGGLHHLRTAKEKVQIGESLTLFFLAFFLSSVALLLLLPGLLMLLRSILSSSIFSFHVVLLYCTDLEFGLHKT